MAVETVFALASGSGRAGVAVIRISGPAAGPVLRQLTGQPLPPPRRAVLRKLRVPESHALIDHGLVLWFPAPGSFTGEDVAELHVHGGPAVVRRLLSELSRQPGCRPADPGEFTRRAFLAGRFDLGQVEGLGDLIAAETEAQRRAAIGAYAGQLGARVAAWRAQLVEMTAVIEAAIDFSDEGDVPADIGNEATGALAGLMADIRDALEHGKRGEQLRDGLVAVLTGAPNVGKSSLLNRLARRDIAIVTPVPGTTRDALEVRLDLDGFPVVLVDTAGLRDSDDVVEREGMARTRQWLARCDLVVEVRDACEGQPGDGGWPHDVAGGDKAVPRLVVFNKVDLAEPIRLRAALRQGGLAAEDSHETILRVSALTGEGIGALVDAMARFATERLAGAETAVLTHERQRFHATAALAALEAAQRSAVVQDGIEIVAEHIQVARQALGHLVGQVGVDEWLDQVFSRFCIGK